MTVPLGGAVLLAPVHHDPADEVPAVPCGGTPLLRVALPLALRLAPQNKLVVLLSSLRPLGRRVLRPRHRRLARLLQQHHGLGLLDLWLAGRGVDQEVGDELVHQVGGGRWGRWHDLGGGGVGEGARDLGVLSAVYVVVLVPEPDLVDGLDDIAAVGDCAGGGGRSRGRRDRGRCRRGHRSRPQSLPVVGGRSGVVPALSSLSVLLSALNGGIKKSRVTCCQVRYVVQSLP